MAKISSGPSFLFSFIKSIKIGRFGYPKMGKDGDPCGEEVLHHIAAQRVPGFWCLMSHCIADMIKEADWGTMIACHMKARFTRMLDNKTYVHST